MKLHIGSSVFRVGCALAPLEDGGDVVLGRVDLDGHRIWISSDCPADHRPEVAGQLALKAWRTCVPPPSTSSERDVFYAMVMVRMLRDIDAQGGIQSLVMLDAGESDPACDTSELTESLAGKAADRLYQCSRCGQRVSSGSVAVGPPQKDPQTGVLAVALAYYCEGCGDVEYRREVANGAGRPSGVPVGEPKRLGGAAAARFCREHPDKTGVIAL